MRTLRLAFERAPITEGGRASLRAVDELEVRGDGIVKWSASSSSPPLVGQVALERLWMEDDGRVLADGHLLVTEGDLAGQTVRFVNAEVSVAGAGPAGEGP